MLLVPLVATAAFLAGCTTATPEPAPSPTTNGVEALEADEILERAQEALDGAKSYRVKGGGELDGEVVELDLLVAGESIEGTVVFEGLELELVVVEGDGAYVKAGDDFWALFLPADVLETVLPLISGKFVKLPAGTEDELIPSADDLLQAEGDVTKGEIVDVDGTKAIAVVDEDGGELHVAIEGEPYPLQIVSDEGTIEFLDIDEDATVEAPDASEVLDLDALMAG
jgi:hypothetical protein